MGTQTWWFVARASGITAWALAAFSVLWGMALSTRALGHNPAAPWLLDLHRFLGALTIVFVGVHMAALSLDTYVHFSLSDLFVPFSSTWRPEAVAWGIVAFYLLVAVEVTSLVKRWIPKKVWHTIHLSSFALYAMATVHLLQAGADASNLVLRYTAIASAGMVLFFFLYRFIGPGKAASVKASKAAALAASRSSTDEPVEGAATGSPRTAAARAARSAELPDAAATAGNPRTAAARAARAARDAAGGATASADTAAPAVTAAPAGNPRTAAARAARAARDAANEGTDAAPRDTDVRPRMTSDA